MALVSTSHIGSYHIEKISITLAKFKVYKLFYELSMAQVDLSDLSLLQLLIYATFFRVVDDSYTLVFCARIAIRSAVMMYLLHLNILSMYGSLYPWRLTSFINIIIKIDSILL